MPQARLDLSRIFELEPHGPDTYVGESPRYEWSRIYGGLVVAQALRAAAHTVQRELLAQVGELLSSAHKKVDVLESETAKAKSVAEVPKQAAAFRDKVFPALSKLRADVDELEEIVPRDLWPVPAYSDMLFKL